MNRLELEKSYWDTAAADPDVDIKYIPDVDTEQCIFKIWAPFNSANPRRYSNTPPQRTLDLGCGVGRLTVPFQLNCLDSQWGEKDKVVYGLDISPKMIEIARARSNGRPSFVLGDGRTVPFISANFDYVYSMLLFQHLPLEAVLGYIEETARVLKPGGMFRFQFIEGDEDEPFSKHHFWPLIREALEESGFDIKDHEIGLLHPQWSWISAKKTLYDGYLGDDSDFGVTNGN